MSVRSEKMIVLIYWQNALTRRQAHLLVRVIPVTVVQDMGKIHLQVMAVTCIASGPSN